MKRVIIATAILGISHVFAGETKMTRSQYVENWEKVAIDQMEKHQIPASITLAQGILESGSGNSHLAVKGNNHFGIKCHDWEGEKLFIDDDSKGECFRAYKKAEESYKDHSEFLLKYDRYKFLFTYEVTDYKSWAHGLKKAGYATNPKYADLLIDLIEELNLQELDQTNVPKTKKEPSIINEKAQKQNVYQVHEVYNHENKVKYVIAKKGDTFYSISKEFGLHLGQLARYNDFGAKKDVLEEGDVIYIQPKRRASAFKKKEMVVKNDVSLIELSQMSAVKIKSIKRLNDITGDDEQIMAGRKVTLR